MVPAKPVADKATLLTSAAAALMSFFKRGNMYRETSLPGWRTAPPPMRKYRAGHGLSSRKNMAYPCTMHVERFDDKTARDDRFRQLRTSESARDVCKGYDVSKWYVAWNGKAA